MIRNTIALFSLLILLLSGCESPISSEFQSAEASEGFQLSIPSNFSLKQDLHDFASFQAADEEHGFFVLGIKEDKEELKKMLLRYSLQDYAWFVERQLMDGIDTLSVERLPSTEINGLRAERFSFRGIQPRASGPMRIWMRACVIESPEAFYQIVSWTEEDRAHWLEPVMEIVECSFREVHPADHEGQPSQGGAESAAI